MKKERNKGMKRKKATNRAFFIKIAILCVLALCLQQDASAANNTPAIAKTPCDTKYFDTLEARAWLEAQREVVQNQNLIFKPDSVLEYTCFDKYANVLAKEAKNMFSETNRWGTSPPGDMAKSLQNVVGTAAKSYLDANFKHDFLGGRMKGSNYSLGSISAGSYSCEIMNKVWEHAKCMNFIADKDHDGFYTFKEYENKAVRFLPTACTADNRFNKRRIEAGLVLGQKPLWVEDKVVTYLDRLDPKKCGKFAAIGTGVLVRRPKQNPTVYDEYVCIQPGCHYSASSDKCTP